MDDLIKDIIDCYNNHFKEETSAKNAEEVIKRLDEKIKR